MAEPNYLINVVFNWIKAHKILVLIILALIILVLWVAC